jgi:NAD(P)-dependent dehydrogenase (short-subunit alcohol dehydrogenase family)
MPTAESRPFEGKTAIVTGGGSGIGQAIALLFARRGAQVAVLDLAAEATIRQIVDDGGVGMHIECDVSKQSAVQDAFEKVAAAYGSVDILVNSAGIAHVGTVETTSEEDLDRIYSVNVKGVYNSLRAGVMAMKGRGGAILNIASVASIVGIPDRFAYSMSKGAVLTMTYSGGSRLRWAGDSMQRDFPGARPHSIRGRLSRQELSGRREGDVRQAFSYAADRPHGPTGGDRRAGAVSVF